jgi:hypothetical protein
VQVFVGPSDFFSACPASRTVLTVTNSFVFDVKAVAVCECQHNHEEGTERCYR